MHGHQALSSTHLFPTGKILKYTNGNLLIVNSEICINFSFFNSCTRSNETNTPCKTIRLAKITIDRCFMLCVFPPFPPSFTLAFNSIGTSSHASRNMPPTWGLQGLPRDRFGGISVWKTCNRLKFSVREMSFWRDKNDVLGTNIIGQLGFSERK